MMDLERLAAAVGAVELVNAGPATVTDLAYDARDATPGSLFFCVPGAHVDGHDFAAHAVASGAVALVVERALDVAVPQVVVTDVRAAMAPAADAFFDHPNKQIRVVGVNGTK